MGRFDEIYRRSIAEPEAFWGEAAEDIHWIERWDKVLDDSRPPFYRWFTGGVSTPATTPRPPREGGRGEQPAIIYDSPVTESRPDDHLSELLTEVARFAGALAQRGVGKGDRVILYMPMMPEAVIAMLACARLGAVHSVVFGGFAANELATRIDDASPSSSSRRPAGSRSTRSSPTSRCSTPPSIMAVHKPEHCVILQRPHAARELMAGRDIDWDEAMAARGAGRCAPRSPPPIRSTSSTPPARPASPRVSSATMAATRWR